MRIATTGLVASTLALLTLGLVVLYSASMVQAGAGFLVKQLLWAGIGCVVLLAAAMLDYRWLKNPYLAASLWVLVVALLAAVLVPGLGVYRGGARRWFDLGPASIQPSELAKLGLLIALACYGARFRRQMGEFWRGTVVPGLLVVPVVGLILIEPDFGAAMMLGTVAAMVMIVAGTRWLHVLLPMALALAAVAFLIAQNGNRTGRVEAWVIALDDPEKARGGANDQAFRGVVALGHGGWTGVGLGKGRQKLGFLKEHHTDFIFTILGEELGAAATFGVVAALMVLVMSGVFIAWNARDTFGLLLGSGLTFLIGLQALINLGVVTMVLPNKGMPLPFVSYGGSNLVTLMASVGLLISIARRAAAGHPLTTVVADPVEA